MICPKGIINDLITTDKKNMGDRREARGKVANKVSPDMVKYNMSKKPLIETNPYLKDRKKYKSALITNVSSSSAIEGIHCSFTKKSKKASKKSQRS